MLRAAAGWAGAMHLSWAVFASWVEQETDQPNSRFARLPSDVCAFRRVFGSWSGACREAGLQSGGPGAGVRVSDGTLLLALRATAEQVGREVVRFEDYLAFAEHAARDPESSFRWLPRSRDAFRSRFGSFGAACSKAGLKNGRLVGGEVQEARVAVAAADYHEDELLDALRQAAESRGGKPPTEAAFREWLEGAEASARGEGRVLTLLAPGAYRQRFGSWPDALHRAGLISETQRRRLKQRREISDDEIWETVTAAVREFGPGIKRTQYQRFAHRLIEESDDPDVRVPSHAAVARRLGGGNFRAAIERVADALREEPGRAAG